MELTNGKYSRLKTNTISDLMDILNDELRQKLQECLLRSLYFEYDGLQSFEILPEIKQKTIKLTNDVNK